MGMGGLMFGGAALTSYGQISSGRYARKLNEFNAQINELRADDATARGLDAELAHRTEVKRLIGSERAAFGASGVEVNDAEGTPGNVYADTAKMGERDALTIRANAAREAWGYKAGASMDIYKGRIAEAEGYAKASGTLMGAASDYYYRKYGFGGTTRGRRA